MKTFLPLLSLLLLGPLVAGPTPAPREETLFVFENRRLTVAVPDGFECVKDKDENGMMTLRLAAPKDKVSGELKFLPDPEGQFTHARARKELMNEMFNEYVGTSSEKAMQFEELDPRTGAGTYCVFTDANLVGKTKLPPGEFMHLTTGIKAWPGVVAIFRFYSNDTISSEYQSMLKMLRESVQEKPVPLK